MSKPTAASNHAEIMEIKGSLALIIAHLGIDSPAKPAAKAPVVKPKATKAPARKPATKAPVKVRALCKATRVAFVAAAAKEGTDFSGCSTKAIAAMCLEDASLVPAGFRIGEGYAALLG